MLIAELIGQFCALVMSCSQRCSKKWDTIRRAKMSEIKRYEMTVLNSFAPDRFKKFGMVESEQGEWVRWEDVQKSLEFLEAEAKELIEELRLMQDQINRLVDE
jgi:hypothetical protein